MVPNLYAPRKVAIYLVTASQDEICYTELIIGDRNVLISLQNVTDIRAQAVEYFTLILERYSGTYPKCATRIGITAAVPNLF
jgi:hypothetical protein